jgi:hypothetical protein
MIFNKNRSSGLDDLIGAQAKSLNIDFQTLKELYEGKACPKYGTDEILHVRKVRGGKLVVFNISEKHRGEKISEGRKKIKPPTETIGPAIDTKKS